MEIFLIILGVVVVAAILTLITSCLVNMTLNPFKYFQDDWDMGCIQWSFGFYVLVIGIFTCIVCCHQKEKKLHSIKTKWNESTYSYDVTVSGSEVKSINIIHEKNND